MNKKLMAVITLLSFILYLHGCYSKTVISVDEFKENPSSKIVKVITNDGEVLEFKFARITNGVIVEIRFLDVSIPMSDVKDVYIRAGVSELSRVSAEKVNFITKTKIKKVVKSNGDSILFEDYATLIDNKIVGEIRVNYRVPLSNVRTVLVRKMDAGKTMGAVIAVPAVIVGGSILALAMFKKSCPFVYSYDGERFVFDGEPYGGSILPAMQRADCCRLDYLKPVDGEYRLLMTNEVYECQHTDEFKLLVVDHSESIKVIPSFSGKLFSIADPVNPLSVIDSSGTDQIKWFAKNDLLFWETNIESERDSEKPGFRETLEFTYPKPKNAKRAKLVVNGCTTLWGSHMIQKLLELQGDRLESFKKSSPVEIFKWLNAIQREEVYHLKINVLVNGKWTPRGVINGGGPLVAEDRVIPIDLTGVEGDKLKIRLSPPAGFWQLNWMAVDYSDDNTFEVAEISAASMIGHDGSDILPVLAKTDKKYYSAPDIGQTAKITFPVPAGKPGMKRTVFAKVTGYYDIYLEAKGPPQTALINRILNEPGFLSKYSMREYNRWFDTQMAKMGR